MSDITQPVNRLIMEARHCQISESDIGRESRDQSEHAQVKFLETPTTSGSVFQGAASEAASLDTRQNTKQKIPLKPLRH